MTPSVCSTHPDLDIPHSKLHTRSILGFTKINIYKWQLVHPPRRQRKRMTMTSRGRLMTETEADDIQLGGKNEYITCSITYHHSIVSL